jgi:hypothetical protein
MAPIGLDREKFLTVPTTVPGAPTGPSHERVWPRNQPRRRPRCRCAPSHWRALGMEVHAKVQAAVPGVCSHPQDLSYRASMLICDITLSPATTYRLTESGYEVSGDLAYLPRLRRKNLHTRGMAPPSSMKPVRTCSQDGV